MAQSKYEKEILPKMQYIVRWAESGMTNDQIAKCLHIARSTLQKYLVDFPEFKMVLQGKKDIADMLVENSLFKSAIGHYVTVKKPMKVKEIEYDKNGKRSVEREKFIQLDEEQYVPPSVLAELAWLKNRQPDKWNDKLTIQHQGEVSLCIEEIVSKSMGDEF